MLFRQQESSLVETVSQSFSDSLAGRQAGRQIEMQTGRQASMQTGRHTLTKCLCPHGLVCILQVVARSQFHVAWKLWDPMMVAWQDVALCHDTLVLYLENKQFDM